MYDGFGYMGLIFDYALIVFFSGSTLILFLYFWKKKRLDFDEAPKYQMLSDEVDHER
jgi:cbb3-type cytochrome oxidase subunit 3